MIRDLQPDDAVAWRELFAAYGVFYETAFAHDVLDRVWALLTAPGSGVDGLIAVDDDGTVVGLAHYRSHPDTFTGHRDWFLDDLFVDPADRGHGTGAALIAAIRQRAQPGDGVLRWITAADNTTAQRLYDRVATRTSWVTYEMAL